MAQRRPPLPRPTTRSSTKEPMHLSLHRRLLFPHHPPEQPLPLIIPLTSTESTEINERIYNLIALSLRAYILSWYPRFTKDRSLLPLLHQSIILPILHPILQTIAHKPDNLLHLILLDIPTIISLHVQTYWSTHAFTSLPIKPATTLSEAYHARLPLQSIICSSSDRCEYALSPLYLTSLTDALLQYTLPVKEYDSTIERSMAIEVISRSVLLNLGNRLSEPCFWWGLGVKLLGEPGYKVVKVDILHSWDEVIWSGLTKVWIGMSGVWTFGIWILTVLSASPPVEQGYHRCLEPWILVIREMIGIDGRGGMIPQTWIARIAWGFVELLLYICSPVLDRIIPYLLRTQFFTPAMALRTLNILEQILFPLDGYPAPTPPEPSEEEVRAMRERLEARLREVIPVVVQQIFRAEHGGITSALDVLGDKGCNAHFVAMAYDAVVASLIPDLVDSANSEPPSASDRMDENSKGRKS